MIIAFLALAWVGVGVMWVAGRLRESREERSISHFHEEHEVLSRRGYSVAPARRLEDVPSYLDDVPEHSPRRLSRATRVVRRDLNLADDDTYHSEEYDDELAGDLGYTEEHAYHDADVAMMSRTRPPRPQLRVVRDDDPTEFSRDPWAQWDRDNTWRSDVFAPEREYADETWDLGESSASRHRYAAYQHVPVRATPVETEPRRSSVPPRTLSRPPGMSMRRRRRLSATIVVTGALVLTGADQVAPSTLVVDLTVVSWVGVGLYAAAYGLARVSGLLGRGTQHPATQPVRLAYRHEEIEEYEVWDESDIARVPRRRDPSRYAMG